MIKLIKIRLNPNNKQLTKLFQYAGCARFAYNWAITREQENYKQGNKFLFDNDLRKEFTQLKKLPEYKWLSEISNNVPKQAIKDACNAYKNFFKGQCKYPKFKSKKHSNSWIYIYPHNHMRITRILKSLKLFGFKNEHDAFLKILKEIYRENQNSLKDSYQYWIYS